MTTDKAIDSASPTSISAAGTGRKKMQRMKMMAAANPTSRPSRCGAPWTNVNDVWLTRASLFATILSRAAGARLAAQKPRSICA
jgi:hypothetical protein